MEDANVGPALEEDVQVPPGNAHVLSARGLDSFSSAVKITGGISMNSQTFSYSRDRAEDGLVPGPGEAPRACEAGRCRAALGQVVFGLAVDTRRF